MAEGRRGLGRGLAALLDETNSATTPQGRREAGVQEIPIELIHRNLGQPRRTFDPVALEELASSIRERGVIAPILLRAAPGASGVYQIVAGERRWRAAQLAGLSSLPALIRALDDLEVMEIALIENIQRADLNALEEAQGYASVSERFGRSAETIAKFVGKSRSHVANTMRLMRLPGTVQEHLQAGRLSAGHARALLGVDDAEALAERVIRLGLNVRQCEALAKRSRDGIADVKAPAAREKDADTQSLEDDLAEVLGLEVDLRDKGGSGELRLRYKTLEQLDDLCRRLTGAIT